MDLDTEAKRYSIWLWLVIPISAAILLLALGRLFPDFYGEWFAREDRGLLELSHVIIPLVAFFIAVRTLGRRELKGRPLLYGWLGFAALGCLFVAGEEASWGQHYFGWETPPEWLVHNDQGETNLHNTSAWLDQKPRALLEIGIIVGGIVAPIVALWRPRLRRRRFAIIVPALICLPTAVLAEFSLWSQEVMDAIDPRVRLFYRPSEVQELFFYWFVLLYLLVLRDRLKAGYGMAAARGGTVVSGPAVPPGATEASQGSAADSRSGSGRPFYSPSAQSVPRTEDRDSVSPRADGRR